MSDEPALNALLHETRSFEPPVGLAAAANAQPGVYADASDRLAFWEEAARALDWETPWQRTLDWHPPFAEWFVGGTLNAAVNCLDRHVAAGRGDKVAFHWIADGDTHRRTLTYVELTNLVCKTANALTELGVEAGDRVAIYMPMIPETVATMLACARLGVAHTVVFCGFSADALRSRILDCDCTVVVTTDGQMRRGAPAPVKAAVDAALTGCPNVLTVLVVRRTGAEVDWTEGRDVWWHDAVDPQSDLHSARAFDAEHPLFIMYTSGTTASPKGILHTTSGYLTQVSWTHRNVFDLKGHDVYWCAADIGWVTGHSYIVYGPLCNGATSIMYEGTPHLGDQDRWWKIIDEFDVTILYTAPTTIRTFMKWGGELLAPYDLSSLRVLGSVGEPINPEAWMWYRSYVGSGTAPIVDTWWQTETGAIMISPLPGVTVTKPGAAMRALPGISAAVVDNDGHPVGNGAGGLLVLCEPWPAMLRGIWGDSERYRDTYWSRFEKEGYYFAGDGAKLDDDGDLWLLGRVDDVMNISGHRISTTEVEHALVGHPWVAEAAVVGVADATTGQAIVAFVTPKGDVAADDAAGDVVLALLAHVAKEIGPIAKPRQILVTPELPKTRSGKIMRRLLQDIAENRDLGDVSTLLDPAVTDAIRGRMAAGSAAAED